MKSSGERHEHPQGAQAEACACAHDHAHAHHDEGGREHNHVEGCACGHSHDANDVFTIEKCSCCQHDEDEHAGHSHGGEAAGKGDVIAFCISIALLIAAFFIQQPVLRAVGFGAAVLLAGYDILLDGLKALVHLRFDETMLMSVASIAAFCLGDYPEAAFIILLFKIGEFLENRAVNKSQKNIQALTNIRPDTALVVGADGSEQVVGARDVAVGTTIRLKPGDRVPLDCRVVDGHADIDASALTGEGQPQSAGPGSALLSGSINLSGVLTCVTTQSFAQSTASRIIDLVRESSTQKSQTENVLRRFSKYYTPTVMVIAALLAALPTLAGFGPISMWLPRALVFLVASCPCALVISIPLSYFSAIGAASRRGVLIKGSRFIDVLARTQCVVLDKTGTITTGALSLKALLPAGGFSPKALHDIAALCEKGSNHPIAEAILRNHPATGDITDVEEIAGYGVSGVVDGKKVFCGNDKLMQRQGVDISGVASPEAGTLVYVAVDGALAGALLLGDTPRPEAAPALERLKALGVKNITLLSGDNAASVQAVARQVHADEAHGALLPQDKVAQMAQRKQRYKNVLFVGDGINDAPVLAMADAGVAMGRGTDVAIESADVVLMADRLDRLPATVRLARRAMGIVHFNIAFALVVKAIVLVLGAMGIAPIWAAVVADVGVSILSVINATRILAMKD
nr:heavy metal translocating P-type ATPase [Maliibacterium massiliense]